MIKTRHSGLCPKCGRLTSATVRAMVRARFEPLDHDGPILDDAELDDISGGQLAPLREHFRRGSVCRCQSSPAA